MLQTSVILIVDMQQKLIIQSWTPLLRLLKLLMQIFDNLYHLNIKKEQ